MFTGKLRQSHDEATKELEEKQTLNRMLQSVLKGIEMQYMMYYIRADISIYDWHQDLKYTVPIILIIADVTCSIVLQCLLLNSF